MNKTTEKKNFQDVCWAFYGGSAEERSFKKLGLPIIKNGDDADNVYSISWLLELKDVINDEIDVFNNEHYALIAKLYKNRHLHAPTKSLLLLLEEGVAFSLLDALLQLIDECT